MSAGSSGAAPVRVALRVRPGASRTAVGGVRGEALVVAVTAPAVDGRATEAALRALADALGARRRHVRLVAGATSRDKVVEIDGEAAPTWPNGCPGCSRERPARDEPAPRRSTSGGPTCAPGHFRRGFVVVRTTRGCISSADCPSAGEGDPTMATTRGTSSRASQTAETAPAASGDGPPAPRKRAAKTAAAAAPAAPTVTRKAKADSAAEPAAKPAGKRASARASVVETPEPAAAPAGVATAPDPEAPVATSIPEQAAPGDDRAAPLADTAASLPVRAGEDPWTPDELREVCQELQAEAERLRREVAETETEIADLLRDSGDGAGDDQADAGNKTFEREHELSLANNSRGMLLQVERALARIDDGSYGTCESCGQPIGKARLQAFPRATLCVSCKQREERR
ncbi:DUF167 family protein [Motilibacter deserti]|uniref:UPF0235 protein G9H71_00530 n=1 Tax=Motilibacter deserti TaxID=2714956 RepID=A0ABX0GN64_9ACTN|nr:DUF167 family protein [Motilibacter deserti]NHC12266.1 hypothetical protein [Motilibacter deserti]